MKSLTNVAAAWEHQLGKDEGIYPFEQQAFEWMLSAGRDATRILEVGAGRGRMVAALQRAGVKAEFVCLDVNGYVKESDGFPVLGDARVLPFADEMFDLTYSLGVVEHFPETAISVAEHARVTKPGGLVVVTVPHVSPYTAIRLAKWFLRRRHLGSFEEVLGRNLRVPTMKGMFQQAGLKIEEATACGELLPRKSLGPVVHNLLPARRYGRYLTCVGRKVTARTDESRRPEANSSGVG